MNLFKDINKFGHILFKKNILNITDSNRIEAEEIILNDEIKCYEGNNIKNSNIRIITKTSNYSHLNRTLEQIYNFIEDKNRIKLESIWVQKTMTDSRHFNLNKLPYIPHIDKKRMFKIMVYLHNVTIEQGPIFLAKCDTNKFENLRLNLSENYKERGENTVKNPNKKKFIDCSGPMGTTIFFDTNCPHFAGKINNNKDCRLVYRFNFLYN